ncbi:tetratricopeptide repeat protein [soil metagenome]
MLPLIGPSLIFSIILCVHVVRTHQQMYWLWIILAFPYVGGLIYVLAVIAPEYLGGSKAQQVGQAARQILDPQREYREATQAVQDTPTVANRARLAVAASGLGRHDEAERLYADALQGLYADDPLLLLGRANALIELNRPAEALPLLETLGALPNAGRTPHTALALGRAQAALGHNAEADTALRWAAAHLPGFEGMARYAVFLAQTGRGAEAQEALDEINKRLAKTHAHFRKEARAWRDLAAAAVAA